MFPKKKTIFLRKLVNDQSQLILPSENSELHVSNIFQTQSPDYQIVDFTSKYSENDILSRNIVGGIDIINKTKSNLKFNQPTMLTQLPKKPKRTLTNDALSFNSSFRSKKRIDSTLLKYKQTQQEQQQGFEVFDKYELLQSMEKIHNLIESNKKKEIKQQEKLTFSEKLIYNQNERAIDRHEKQLQHWNELQQKITSKINQHSTTLIDRQKKFRQRVDSLYMFEDLQPEDQKNPAITWQYRLRSKNIPLEILKQQEDEKIQLKQSLLKQIPKKEILDISNPIKLIQDLKNNIQYDKHRSVSEFDQLKLFGYGVYEKELKSLKNDKTEIQQQYFRFKPQKNIEENEVFL